MKSEAISKEPIRPLIYGYFYQLFLSFFLSNYMDHCPFSLIHAPFHLYTKSPDAGIDEHMGENGWVDIQIALILRNMKTIEVEYTRLLDIGKGIGPNHKRPNNVINKMRPHIRCVKRFIFNATY